jgi:carboxymethylenebutenolidase
MPGTTVKIRSRDHVPELGAFDCYLALPEAPRRVPAIVIACAIMGVDADIRDLADSFAAQGYIAAAPDLFWRSVPGPLPREDPRAYDRSLPRLERLKAGEADLSDTLAHIQALPQSNGRAAIMGLCYSGPYAITGPKRLGYAAGISCHGSQMQDFIGDLDGVSAPVCIVWGDQDDAAPPSLLAAYEALPAQMPNVAVHVLPGAQHGFMMPTHQGFSASASDFSIRQTLALLAGMNRA